MRGGFERFELSGPSEEECSLDFWTKEGMIDQSRDKIADRFILRVHPNMEFHASCLKCTECLRQLDESCTAFVRNGRTYCKEDYLRSY
uniref:LIM zinc-binding domain-containing protein n=1 Tax=Heterorhabditis bacteriophora TaxID=37862 RepID=A0A1I7W8U9_HETBA